MNPTAIFYAKLFAGVVVGYFIGLYAGYKLKESNDKYDAEHAKD